MIYIYPRSTVFRIGAAVAVGQSKFWQVGDIQGALLNVVNPFGISLQENAKVAQGLVFASNRSFLEPHGFMSEISQGLTVSRIFEFRKQGRLGVGERDTDIVREIRKKTHLSKGCLLRFKEVIKVGPSEVVTSYNDRVAMGVFLMGAVADPGYEGQLNACLLSPLAPVKIEKGVACLKLRKARITPVKGDKLYNGKYQNTGVGKTRNKVLWGGDF